MPHQVIARGHTANLGANTVHGDLQVIGVGANYTLSINGGAAVPHIIALGHVHTHPINNQSVSLTNTTPAGGPPNLTMSW